MNIIPTVVDYNKGKEYACDIYSLLLTNRIIFLSGEINDVLANNIVAQLLYLDSLSKSDIYIYINSPGGNVTSGLAIYDTINYIKSNVITIGFGNCASMGAFLLACGNKRYALPNCEIMIHEVFGGATGQATDISIINNQIQKLKHIINSILSEKTGKSIKTIEKDTHKDNYMSAHEALKYGLIDKVIKKEI